MTLSIDRLIDQRKFSRTEVEEDGCPENDANLRLSQADRPARSTPSTRTGRFRDIQPLNKLAMVLFPDPDGSDNSDRFGRAGSSK